MDGITKLVVRVKGNEGGASICIRGRRIHAKNFVSDGIVHKFALQESLVIGQSWGAVQRLLDDSCPFIRVTADDHCNLGLPASCENRRGLLGQHPAIYDAFDVEVDRAVVIGDIHNFSRAFRAEFCQYIGTIRNAEITA